MVQNGVELLQRLSDLAPATVNRRSSRDSRKASFNIGDNLAPPFKCESNKAVRCGVMRRFCTPTIKTQGN